MAQVQTDSLHTYTNKHISAYTVCLYENISGFSLRKTKKKIFSLYFLNEIPFGLKYLSDSHCRIGVNGYCVHAIFLNLQ